MIVAIKELNFFYNLKRYPDQNFHFFSANNNIPKKLKLNNINTLFHILKYYNTFTIIMSYTETLFTEICSRGCAIKTKSKYSTIHLPRCLVTIDDYIYMPQHTVEFQMTIISKHKYTYICFVKHPNMKDCYTWYVHNIMGNNVRHGYFDFGPQNDRGIEIDRLDFLVELLYRNDTKCSGMCSLPNNTCHYQRQILKDKMITDLMELYTEKYIYLANMLSIVELGSIIINMLIILDEWHNVYTN